MDFQNQLQGKPMKYYYPNTKLFHNYQKDAYWKCLDGKCEDFPIPIWPIIPTTDSGKQDCKVVNDCKGTLFVSQIL